MKSATATSVLVSVAERVATVTLNRPDRLNAFTGEMVEQLRQALEGVADDDGVRVIVLTGAGRAFSAGADIGLLGDIRERGDEELGRRLVDGARHVHGVLRGTPKPVLCALNGVAAGGGANLALACDLRLASENAAIGQVFARIGLHPDWGGTFLLPRMVGTAAALELFWSAELVPAARLHQLGLVNRVVPAADLEAEARSWAARLAALPPLAAGLVKQAVYRSAAATLEEMLDFELEAQMKCFHTDDFREGLAAFLDKREPLFTGR